MFGVFFGVLGFGWVFFQYLGPRLYIEEQKTFAFTSFNLIPGYKARVLE